MPPRLGAAKGYSISKGGYSTGVNNRSENRSENEPTNVMVVLDSLKWLKENIYIFRLKEAGTDEVTRRQFTGYTTGGGVSGSEERHLHAPKSSNYEVLEVDTLAETGLSICSNPADIYTLVIIVCLRHETRAPTLRS